jgi:hypothetical protein
MIRVSLDDEDGAVKQFFISLTLDPDGTLLKLSGKPVALVLPPPKSMTDVAFNEKWTDAKNGRRCDLIDREFDGPPLTPAEVVELAGLQEEMLRYRDRVAVLPIEAARKLHQELLAKAAARKVVE